MERICTRSFDEELISGYLDRALPQAAAQRVRLHLEECPACRRQHDEMKALREAATSTRFQSPRETEWPELPATRPGRWSRSLGWTVLTAWLVVVAGYALWRFLAAGTDPLGVFLVLGLPGALVLLFASVALDRLEEIKTDRYRGIHR